MKPLNFFMKVMNGDFKKYLGIIHKKKFVQFHFQKHHSISLYVRVS